MDKGKSVERQVARMLSELTGREWHRVPHSGAFSKFSKDRAYQGDLVCDGDLRDWVVEVKSTKEVFKCYDFYRGHHLLRKWLAQVERESMGRPWVLIIRDYRMPSDMMYVISKEAVDWLVGRVIGKIELDGYLLYIVKV